MGPGIEQRGLGTERTDESTLQRMESQLHKITPILTASIYMGFLYI